MAFFGSRKTPAGPSGPLDQYELDLSGSKFSIDFPPQNHDLIEGTLPGRRAVNIYDLKKFGRNDKRDRYEPMVRGLIAKDWLYRGLPIIDGVIGDLKCYVDVRYFEGFGSLFRPRRLEAAIDRYIYNGGERTEYPGETRLNWRIFPLNNHSWVNYEVNCPPGINNAEEVRLSIWQLAIADEHLLTIYFRQIFRKSVPALRKIFSKTIRNIMGSVQLELSETSAAQKKAAETQFPWEKLSENRPPYVFDKHEKLDDYHMFVSVNAEFGESITYEETKAKATERLKEQKILLAETKQQILDSHMRFEALEREDEKRYRESREKNAS